MGGLWSRCIRTLDEAWPSAVRVRISDFGNHACYSSRFSFQNELRSKRLCPQGALEAAVCSDPAILACDHFPKRRHAPRDRPVLGLNIARAG